MLLAVDIGNSTISTGLFGLDGELRFLASLDTDYRKTADQICVDLMNLFQLYHFRYEDVTDSILCSVVPPLNFMMEKALTRLLGKPPVVVGPGVKTGLNIRLAVQSQVGADIVADAVCRVEQFTAPIITIDMGTATTIGVISEGRTYEGGLLLPGVNVSLEALSRRAAQLPAISLQAPKNLIGKSTEDCMRSGIVYGTAAMLDGIIDRIRGEFPGKELHIVATGGSADTLSSSRPSSSSTRGMERNRFSSTLFPPRARHAVRRVPVLQFAFTLSERLSPVKKNQNRSLNQPCSSGFSIVHKSADRPVAANFQFLKISVSLGQHPVGACPPQALLGSSTANWKL